MLENLEDKLHLELSILFFFIELLWNKNSLYCPNKSVGSFEVNRVFQTLTKFLRFKKYLEECWYA